MTKTQLVNFIVNQLEKDLDVNNLVNVLQDEYGEFWETSQSKQHG